MCDEVSFVDIYVDDDIVERAVEVLESGRYVKGPECESFEAAFASACGTDYAVGVSSGTAALLLSMKALEIAPGDQVFVPAHTYFATVSPVLELGAEPVFVDIDPDRYTMDPGKLREQVENAESPSAVAVTHMHGQPAAVDPILDVVDEHNLALIEDAAQAHLAQYDGRRVGSFGDVGCFSFYPTKNMTVGGDGGMIVTDDEALASAARALRNHGRDDTGEHRYLGLNYRLDEIKAAIGSEQLRLLPEWTSARREVARAYNRQLASVDNIITPSTFEQAVHVYHHYPIQVPNGDRESFRSFLDDQGIGTGVHYNLAAHEHPAVKERIDDTNAPVAESLCSQCVSLPMHPRLEKSEVETVCTAIEEYFA